MFAAPTALLDDELSLGQAGAELRLGTGAPE